MTDQTLPTEEQRKELCELLHWAFVEIRLVDVAQAHDLADTFHNLPNEMYGSGRWNLALTRGLMQRYQEKYRGKTYDYVAAFDKIFPDLA
jgi:hypothetical protein